MRVALTMLGILAICAALVLPDVSYARPQQIETPVTVTGTVTDFKYGRRGEVEGFYLDNGTEVRFPEHRAWEVTQAVTIGTPVRVEGSERVGRRGDVHVKAQVITNTNTNTRVVIEEVVNVGGQIVEVTYSRSGRVNGFVLNTGDVVRTPPPLARALAALPADASVQVIGVRRIDKNGEEHIKPDTITNRATGRVIWSR
ncbi:hypothetical protein [Roseiflexus castenholzii]|uniref:DUF5666 domain-containing protein n=1 Tax=Roseiflexus castenholzii (strain DSM 13941 / HLO8) TaxID=383372 RepID=A7NN56_ROSCS|nr:hypothetical protein [Roseiflexus castenholzii]ABU58988.1 hypothetical protein Rcas_2926 [Roseiflexus castenholzii DSM 13941]